MKKVILVNIIIKISGAPKYITEIGLAMVTKKFVSGVGDSVTLLLGDSEEEGLGVEIFVTLREADGTSEVLGLFELVG